MALYSSIAKVKAVSDINNENVTGREFTDTEITDALNYANARILLANKEWVSPYTAAYDTYVALIFEQVETAWAAAWLFEQKGNQFMNLTVQGESFSVGDLSISADPGAQKQWYEKYQLLADRYYKLGQTLLSGMCLPFYFEQCISVKDAEDAEIGV